MIAGGLFVIDREYFHKMGNYDMQMDIWGGENLGNYNSCSDFVYIQWRWFGLYWANFLPPLSEISFRIWQCGGSLEIIPCSRVGHVFRKQHPYSFPGGSGNIFARNTRRFVRSQLFFLVFVNESFQTILQFQGCWSMDGWLQKILFRSRSHGQDGSFRRVSPTLFHRFLKNLTSSIWSYIWPFLFFRIRDRLLVREKLQCKSFKWYVENVYPELLQRLPKVYTTSATKFGAIKYQSECFDTYGRPSGSPISLYSCHGTGGNQVIRSSFYSKIALTKLSIQMRF